MTSSEYHWGYHGQGWGFEGWYFRLSLPELHKAVAFMYEVRPHQGASMQILGWHDENAYHPLPLSGFQADYGALSLGAGDGNCYFHVSAHDHRGQLGGYRWQYEITTQVPWPKPTMGWLSYLPVFAPYWQILQVWGVARGWIAHHDRLYSFVHAPIYSEKNWGSAFPRRWYWLQCNAWQDQHHLGVISAGGMRSLLGQERLVAMVGLYWQGQIYQFMPENAQICCAIAPWGSWYIIAQQQHLRLELEGWSDRPPTPVLVPNYGVMQYACRDTGEGNLRLSLWQRDRRILTAYSSLAGLETGGDYWADPWRFNSELL